MTTLSGTYRAHHLNTLCDLIRIPSRSSPAGGEEAQIQQYVFQRMHQLGARATNFQAADIPSFFHHPICFRPERDYTNRATVIGEIGPQDAPALLLLAHSDTVPIFEPEKWTCDPFEPRFENGRIYGLGVGDDKWGVASLLTLMEAFQKTPLQKRLIFASTIDEEHGVGNGVLLLHLAGVQAEAALYMDGYDSTILLGHLGGSTFFLQPNSDLSDEDFSACLNELDVTCRYLSQQRETLFQGNLLEDSVMRCQSVIAGQRQKEDGPIITIRFYTVEGEEPAEVQRRLEQLIDRTLGEDRAKFSIEVGQPWFEPAFTSPDTPFVKYMSEAYRRVKNSEPLLARGAKGDPFVLINHANIPTISFAPSRSQSPGAFHEPDEFVYESESWEALQIVHGAICKWLET